MSTSARHGDAPGSVSSGGPTDLRWEWALEEPVRATDWFVALDPDRREAFARERVAHALRMGIEFESGLIHGLLAHLATIDAAAPEALFLRGEIAEEADHSRRFATLIAGMGTATWPDEGLTAGTHVLTAQSIMRSATTRPEVFWVLVLAGEEPIDVLQRGTLRSHGSRLPVALADLLRLHVREEARHVHFARHELRRLVATLPSARRTALAVGSRRLVETMGRRMVAIPPALLASFGCPEPDAAALTLARTTLSSATGRTYGLLAELGVVTDGPTHDEPN